jgi:hypothetical protein
MNADSTAAALDLFGHAPQEPSSNDTSEAGSLVQRFIVPPFSVLDTKAGYWQERRRAWLSLGIQSEVGRPGDSGEDGLLHQGATVNTAEGDKWEGGRAAWQNAGTSIFDPVLCELAYRWFCPPDGLVLDPFAGGSVRGIVAHRLGYRYRGVELREVQVEANKLQAALITPSNQPAWWCGDSVHELPRIMAGARADMVFTCPPYFDLEVYSTEPDDLSAMDWPGFRHAYSHIIKQAIALLRPNSFSVWVVSNVRDKRTGAYRDLRGLTVEAHAAAGAELYNEAILVNAVGSLPVRITRQFAAGRKLGRMHQEVLCFVKGDAKAAAERIGETQTEFGLLGGGDPAQLDLLEDGE